MPRMLEIAFQASKFKICVGVYAPWPPTLVERGLTPPLLSQPPALTPAAACKKTHWKVLARGGWSVKENSKDSFVLSDVIEFLKVLFILFFPFDFKFLNIYPQNVLWVYPPDSKGWFL